MWLRVIITTSIPLQGIVKEVSSQSPIPKGVRIVSDGDNGLHS